MPHGKISSTAVGGAHSAPQARVPAFMDNRKVFSVMDNILTRATDTTADLGVGLTFKSDETRQLADLLEQLGTDAGRRDHWHDHI